MSLLDTATEDRTGIMSSLASRRVGNCDEPLARDLAKLEIVVHDDDNEEENDEVNDDCPLSVVDKSGAVTAPAYGIISDTESALKR